ncbi:putative toxin-antitoxin system toxin component, PIN family [Lysobacter xanthus]
MRVPEPGEARTLVLDTNAWLDLLVFDDAALAGVEADACDGSVRLAVDGRTLAELRRVLRYPVLGLARPVIDATMERAQRLGHAVDVGALPPLPACRDPDDQMFLEVAVASHARTLLTRDDDLLRMHRRMSREHGLAILTPAAWRAQMSKR